MFYPLDSQNTNKPNTKMLSFYKQQSQIVAKKAKITISFFQKKIQK